MSKRDLIKTGPTAWILLDSKYLSDEGKRIVSADPDLSDETMRRLKAVESNAIHREFYFDEQSDESDIGLSMLALCIGDNPDSTLAELAARYAETHKASFYDCAEQIIQLHKASKIFRFDFDSNGVKEVPWSPRKAKPSLPPAPKRFSA